MSIVSLLLVLILIFLALCLKSSSEIVLHSVATDNDVIYLNEWILYHKSIGFDRILLVDTTAAGGLAKVLSAHLRYLTIVRNGIPLQELLGNIESLSLCLSVSVNEFVVVPNNVSIRNVVDSGDLTEYSTLKYYNTIVASGKYSPDLLLKRLTLRSKIPFFYSHPIVLSKTGSIDNREKSGRTISEVYILRSVLLTRTEHRWYVEWLCGEYPQSVSGVVGGHDRRDYSAVCSVYHDSCANTTDSVAGSSGSAVGIVGQTHFRDRYSSDSEWMRWFDAYYDALRSEYESAQLVEDTAAWQRFVSGVAIKQSPRNAAYYNPENDDFYQSLILSHHAADTSEESNLLLSSQFHISRINGEEIASLNLYHDRDIPQQLIRFCIDFELASEECEGLTQLLFPHNEIDLRIVLAKLNQSVDLPKLNKLVRWYDSSVNVFSPDEYEEMQKYVHVMTKKLHPDECFRGWRSGETMLLSSQNQSFLMYVINHDDASEALIYDTLFHSSSNNNSSSRRSGSNGVLVPVRVRSSVFFEYIAYREVLPGRYVSEWSQLQYVGITTYKTVVQYASLCTYELERLLAVGAAKDYDVIPLVRPKQDLMVTSVLKHRREFRYAWDAVLTALGYNQSTIRRYDRMKPFYRSSMLIKPSWLVRLSQFMSRAMEVVQFNATLYEMCSVDARYFDSDAEVSRRIFNSSRYQLFPFVFERLPSFYLISEGASVCHGSDECPFNFHWTGSN